MARQWSAMNDENFNRERLLCRAGGAPGWRSAKPPPYDRMIRMIRMTRRAGAAPMPGRCREASMPGWLQVYNNKAACSCPSSLSKFGGGTWTRNLDNCGLPCYKLSQYYPPIPGRPRFRVPRPGGNPNLDKNLDKELGQILSRVFLLQCCGLPCYKLSQCYAPIPGRPRFRVPCPGGNPNLDKNLDKELGQILSRVFLLQSHLSKFAWGTWTRNLDNCGLPCYKLSQSDSRQAPIPCASLFRGRFPNGFYST